MVVFRRLAVGVALCMAVLSMLASTSGALVAPAWNVQMTDLDPIVNSTSYATFGTYHADQACWRHDFSWPSPRQPARAVQVPRLEHRRLLRRSHRRFAVPLRPGLLAPRLQLAEPEAHHQHHRPRRVERAQQVRRRPA